jgi:hypothetical protein
MKRWKIPLNIPLTFTNIKLGANDLKRMKFADLHIHSRASDGWITAEEVVELAAKTGLAAIAIVDHDTVDSIEAAIKAGKKYSVEVIPGVELSSEIRGAELHILGYFINWRDGRFQNKLREIQKTRRNRAQKILEKLQRFGVEISFQDLASMNGSAIGRLHIAQTMLDGGYVKTIDEAFDKYLGLGKPACVEKYPLTPAEAISMIRKVDGIAVLAHPTYVQASGVLPKLIKMGLQGIEVYHSKHDAATAERYRKLAKKYGLLITGGSDSHGREIAVGDIQIPYSFVEKLRKYHENAQ